MGLGAVRSDMDGLFLLLSCLTRLVALFHMDRFPVLQEEEEARIGRLAARE
jgi:hypothetical protein